MESDNVSYRVARLEYILSGILYGTIGLFLHYVNLPSEVVVLFRGFIGSLFIVLYLKFRRVSLDFSGIKSNLLYLILSGAGLGLNWVFLFSAYRCSSVALGTLCNYMGPIIVIALSPILYKEKLTLKKLLCVLMALVGIVLVSGILDPNTKVNTMGIVWGLLSAVCFVALVIFNKKLKNISSYDKAVSQLLVSAMTVLPYALIVNWGSKAGFDTKSVIICIILGVVHTGVAYIFYFRALGKLSVQTFSILGYIEPVVAVILSATVLKEPITPVGIVGAVLIIGAAVLSELV